MTKRAFLVLFLLTLCLAIRFPTAALAQSLTFEKGEQPATEIQPNAAYGSVKFSLELLQNNRPTNRSVYEVLLNSLSSLMKEAGEYTLTIEILGNNDEVLARRAIVQARREKSGWFIFARVVKESEAREWYGELISNLLVRPDTNNIRIKVRSYYTKDSKLDLTTFNLFADILQKTKVLGAANTALDAVWRPVAQQIETLLSSYQQTDVSDIASLSFAKFNGDPYAASGTFHREYIQNRDDAPPIKWKVRVKISTDTTAARVALIKNGKLEPKPSYTDVLAAARVGDQPIAVILASSKTDAVQKFMVDLASSGGYADEDIGEKCDLVSSELAKHFSVTDKVVTYWAILHLYRRKIGANKNATDCLHETVREQIVALGLNVDGLPFSKPAVVATARLESVNDGKPAADKVDRAIPSQELVERVLGEKNSDKTFQVIPTPNGN